MRNIREDYKTKLRSQLTEMIKEAVQHDMMFIAYLLGMALNETKVRSQKNSQ